MSAIKTKRVERKISLLTNVAIWIISSIVLNLILEILQRRSLSDAFVHMFTRGHIFLLNTAIILLCTSFMLIVKRKIFAFVLPAFIWIVVGVTNTILLSFRPLPISFSDFRLAGEALEIMPTYFSIFEIILIALGIIAAIAGIILVFFLTPRYDSGLKRSLCVFIPVIIILVTLAVLIHTFDFLPRGNETPNEYYERNGFVYNFYKSAGTTGVNTPLNYPEGSVEKLIREIESSDSDITEYKPNVIVLQLESFFDMSWMHGVETSEDTVPNYRKIKEEGASGYLFVPSYGGGTSNVEFEILTGMNLDHFTIGESPYYTLLNKNVLTDAVPFNMKKLGYTAHAIHNYNALFYERNIAYNNLGFDTFTSVEYMNDLSFNSQGWTRDDVLTKEIITALDSTSDKDFVFTVSVQGHGPYPEKVSKDEFPEYIEVKADNLTPERLAGLTYYACTVREMDNMLGDLIKALEEYDEKCVLVVYGDHLPAIDFSVNYLSAPNAYTSEYVIWSNYGLTGEDKDLETYQLLAHVKDMTGLEEGILTKYHLNYSSREDYQDTLKLIEFSMTNDENATRDGEIRFSSHPVKINGISINNHKIEVSGENFTPCSKIAIGDKILDTTFASPEFIYAKPDTDFSPDDIKVYMMTRDGNDILETIEH